MTTTITRIENHLPSQADLIIAEELEKLRQRVAALEARHSVKPKFVEPAYNMGAL